MGAASVLPEVAKPMPLLLAVEVTAVAEAAAAVAAAVVAVADAIPTAASVVAAGEVDAEKAVADFYPASQKAT